MGKSHRWGLGNKIGNIFCWRKSRNSCKSNKNKSRTSSTSVCYFFPFFPRVKILFLHPVNGRPVGNLPGACHAAPYISSLFPRNKNVAGFTLLFLTENTTSWPNMFHNIQKSSAIVPEFFNKIKSTRPSKPTNWKIDSRWWETDEWLPRSSSSSVVLAPVVVLLLLVSSVS